MWICIMCILCGICFSEFLLYVLNMVSFYLFFLFEWGFGRSDGHEFCIFGLLAFWWRTSKQDHKEKYSNVLHIPNWVKKITIIHTILAAWNYFYVLFRWELSIRFASWILSVDEWIVHFSIARSFSQLNVLYLRSLYEGRKKVL